MFIGGGAGLILAAGDDWYRNVKIAVAPPIMIAAGTMALLRDC